MNKTRKFALLCAVAGCLVLVVIIGVMAYRSYRRQTISQVDTNRAANGNLSGSDFLRESSSFTYDDDKHKLFQAAGITKDKELIARVLRKIGFVKPDATITADYQQFLKEHVAWARKNAEFVNSVNTPQKARAYLKAHPVE